jgi:hypothetical protein
VLWEIELLARHPDVAAVFVLHADRIATLAGPDPAGRAARGTPGSGLHKGPAGLARFARAVRAIVEQPDRSRAVRLYAHRVLSEQAQ